MSATTIGPTPTAQPKLPRAKHGSRVTIPFADWEMYEELLKVFERRPRVRLTYDRGELEIMAPSQALDLDGPFLAWLIVILTEELQLPIREGGSTTLKRKRVKRGLEPDKCFWIANAAKLARVRQLDLDVHPPPDLVLEMSCSVLDRLGIYRALGVPEVWRLDGDSLVFYTLVGKKYQAVSHSRTFPVVASDDLIPFVQQARSSGDLTPICRAFRAWVKQRVAGPPATP